MSMFNFNRTTSTASESTETTEKKEYDNTNRGCLWPNKYKFSAKAPDLTGFINIDGKDVQLAVWQYQDKNGKPYLSMSVDKGRPSK